VETSGPEEIAFFLDLLDLARNKPERAAIYVAAIHDLAMRETGVACLHA
jgi:hypothetical protein